MHHQLNGCQSKLKFYEQRFNEVDNYIGNMKNNYRNSKTSDKVVKTLEFELNQKENYLQKLVAE